MPFHLAPEDLLLLYTEARPCPGTAPEDARGILGEVGLAASHTMDADATISHLTNILDAHHNGWASDGTALLALRVSAQA